MSTSPGLNDRMRRRVQKSTSEATFVAKAEDGVYKAAEIVKEEAKVVEEIAQRVETLSTTVEEDIDRVEAFVHQVIVVSTESIEKAVDGASVALDSSSQPSSSRAVAMPKDLLALGRGWNVIRISVLLLTFGVVAFRLWGGFLPYIKGSALEPQSSATSSKTVTLTAFSTFLINLGPIVRALKLIKNVMTGKKKMLAKVEEDVDEVAQEVKSTVERVEGVAHFVEHISQQVEQEAGHIQGLISQAKSTSTSML